MLANIHSNIHFSVTLGVQIIDTSELVLVNAPKTIQTMFRQHLQVVQLYFFTTSQRCPPSTGDLQRTSEGQGGAGNCVDGVRGVVNSEFSKMAYFLPPD
jgi:hypothetical protein